MRDEFKNALSKLRESTKKDPDFWWNEEHIKLSSKFDNIIFHRAGGACPVQAEGLYEDEPFYFRYRWGVASLGWGGDNPVLAPQFTNEMSYGDAMGGSMSLGEFHQVFTKLLQSLIRERAGKNHGI